VPLPGTRAPSGVGEVRTRLARRTSLPDANLTRTGPSLGCSHRRGHPDAVFRDLKPWGPGKKEDKDKGAKGCDEPADRHGRGVVEEMPGRPWRVNEPRCRDSSDPDHQQRMARGRSPWVSGGCSSVGAVIAARTLAMTGACGDRRDARNRGRCTQS
jgi:hypothetical protein